MCWGIQCLPMNFSANISMADPELSLSSCAALQNAINVTQGAWVVEDSRLLYTILGSCVSVCLYDSITGIGGMNHFVYPPRSAGMAARFGNTSFSADLCMEGLLEALLRKGARKDFLRAKAFGGGRMFEYEDALSVGKRNSIFARDWLADANIPLDITDFHGPYSRRLIFHPASGQHLCQRILTRFQSASVS